MASEARGGPAGAPDQPPFSMPMQNECNESEWTALFGDLMGCDDSADPIDVIWEGRPWDDPVHFTPSSRQTDSDDRPFAYTSVHEANVEDEDEVFIRRHTLSLSGSDDGLQADEDPTGTLPLMQHRYIPPRRRINGTQRPHSDGSIRYVQGQSQQPPLTFSSRPRVISDVDAVHSPEASAPVSSAFPRIDVGATVGRSPPALHALDWSSCSHRFISINLKLLWSNDVKRSVQQWMDVFSRPYEPPAFVKVSQAATAEWKRAKGLVVPVDEKAGSPPEAAPVDEPILDAEAVATFDLNSSLDSIPATLSPSGSFQHPDVSRPTTPSTSRSSADSDTETAAMDMMALVRGSEDSPMGPGPAFSPQVFIPAPLSVPPSLPSSRHSSVDGPPTSSGGGSSRSFFRTFLKAYEGRRESPDMWLSLFSMDLVRPQMNFSSKDTNSRLVLAAARARVNSEGLPIYLHRLEETDLRSPASRAAAGGSGGSGGGGEVEDDLVLTGFHQLESFVYFEKKHSAALTDAQAFVCPIDLEGDGRVQWVKDSDVMRRSTVTADVEKKEPTAVPSERRKSRGTLMGFWSGDTKARDDARDAAAALLVSTQKDLGGSGVLRKIVEPCTMHFAMTAQCNIEEELNARRLFVADEVNGIVMHTAQQALLGKPVRSSTPVPGAVAGEPAQGEKARTLTQSIQLFLPAFSAHLDSNEYFTLLGVVQALFLSPFASSSSSQSVADEEEVKSPPANKEEFQALMERLLDEDQDRRRAHGGRSSRKKVARVVQYYVGGSVWQLFQHRTSPFIAAHVHGLYGTHTFFDDLSSDTEFSIHFLTLQSKLLPEGDALANLVIPDPDRWMARDYKRDMMISVRAKVHAPLLSNDERVKGVRVYEHFEVTVFPLILRFPHDHYVCIRRYFFPHLQDVSEEEKAKAAQNFFQLPNHWRRSAKSPSSNDFPGRHSAISPTGTSVRSAGALDSRGPRDSPIPSSPHSSPRAHPLASDGLRSFSGSLEASPLSSPSIVPSPAFPLPPHSRASEAPSRVVSRGSGSNSESRPLHLHHSILSSSAHPEASSTFVSSAAVVTRGRGDRPRADVRPAPLGSPASVLEHKGRAGAAVAQGEGEGGQEGVQGTAGAARDLPLLPLHPHQPAGPVRVLPRRVGPHLSGECAHRHRSVHQEPEGVVVAEVLPRSSRSTSCSWCSCRPTTSSHGRWDARWRTAAAYTHSVSDSSTSSPPKTRRPRTVACWASPRPSPRTQRRAPSSSACPPSPLCTCPPCRPCRR